jgi:hypothetical protein
LKLVDERFPQRTGRSLSECNVYNVKLQKKTSSVSITNGYGLDDLGLIFDTKAFLLHQVELTLVPVHPPIQLKNKSEVPPEDGDYVSQQPLNRFPWA